MTPQNIADLWHNTVKHGTSMFNSYDITKTTYFRFFMSADASECSHNIRDNDPLYFSGWYDHANNVFKVTAACIYTNPPAGSHLALGRINLRIQTIKNATPAKIQHYFDKVFYELINANIHNLPASQSNLTDIYVSIIC
jgi:hypothetical protein